MGTYFEKMHAENVARRITGVVEVRNHLEVDFPDSFTQSPYVYPYWSHTVPLSTRIPVDTWKRDRELAENIESELFWSPFVDEGDVTVVVQDGVATLTGTVDSWGEYNAARNNAIEGGAVRVINKLQVE